MLAIARGWTRRRLAKPVAIPAWLGCAVLVLRGAAGLIDDLTRAAGVLPNGITGLSTGQTTGSASFIWSGWAIDAYFLIGGMIFAALAISHSNQSRRHHTPTTAAPPSP